MGIMLGEDPIEDPIEKPTLIRKVQENEPNQTRCMSLYIIMGNLFIVAVLALLFAK